MKTFIKIFLITLAIEVGGSAMGILLSSLGNDLSMLDSLGSVFLFGCVPAAIIVDIILAIRWGTNIKQKLIYIFLMPTNYFWLLYVLLAFWYIGLWIDMLLNW